MDRSVPDSPQFSSPRPAGSARAGFERRRPRRVLVSGGAGFIGTALVRALGRDGVECTLVDDLSAGTGQRLERLRVEDPKLRCFRMDVNQPGTWGRILAEAGPFDGIVHLAGRVGVRRVLEDPEACRDSNVAGARELVAALAAMRPEARPRVFAASSSEVYADSTGPLRELSPVRSAEGRGRWAYAASKRSSEAELDAARPLWSEGEGPVHLRFFNVVGPGQDARTGMVMPTFVEHALRDEPLPVHGRGQQVRTFGHVEDVARSLAALVQHPAFPPGPVNLGGRTRTSILELADTVLARVDRARNTIERSRTGRLAFVDPCQRIGDSFEEVRVREPDLARAASLGLPIPARSLVDLVDDCISRHGALSIGSAGERRRLAVALGVPDPEVTHAGGEGIACASLGS